MDRLLKKTEAEIETSVAIIPNTLYFAVLRSSMPNRRLKSNESVFYFSIDEELLYQNYYCDFGPLNISCLYKYCQKLSRYLQYSGHTKGVVHYTCSNPDKKANAAFLIGCFCVVKLKIAPKDVLKLLQIAGPFKPFLDASQFACQFTLKLIDCFEAIAKALAFNFIDFNDFNASEYDLYNKLEYGDINWLLPRKFLAFIGPADNRTAHPPEFYIKYFLKNDVKTVIRLNHILYDANAFMQVGIQHYDLIFPDGSTPPKEILLRFLYIAETAPAAIGVHCKAGLGRTGSLVAAYIMKHYRMTAREAIAWLRICRPGSVIGQQQIWLEKIQCWLWRVGSQYRLQHYGEGDKIPRHKYGINSVQWPVERDKAIRAARMNIQNTFTNTHINNFVQVTERQCERLPRLTTAGLKKTQRKRKMSPSSDKLAATNSKLLPCVGNSFKNIARFLSSVHGIYPAQYSNTVMKKLSTSEKCIHCKGVEKKNVDKETQKCTQKTQGDKLNQIKLMRNHKHKNV